MTRRSKSMPGVIGPYAILERIAKGEIAEVFLAQRAEEPMVVLKRIRPEHCEHEDFVAMFLTEVELAASLRHPNIVRVYDHGEDGGYYLVMEHVDGGDLAALLRRVGPLVPTLVAYVGAEIARALVLIHHSDPQTGRKPLVHCDVTPHNVLLGRDGAVKVSDFGLARALRKTGAETLTRVRGLPFYLSPEQWLGEPVGSRADLFALGLVLWRALVGTHPFAEGRPAGARQQLNDWIREHTIRNERRPAADAAPRAPAVLLRLIDRLLQPVADRIASAEECLAELSPLASDAQPGLATLVAGS
jgi:serine/threonine protein kinase